MKDNCNCPMPTEKTDEWIPHELECPQFEDWNGDNRLGDGFGMATGSAEHDDTQVCISHDKNLTLEQVREKHLAGECAACAEAP